MPIEHHLTDEQIDMLAEATEDKPVSIFVALNRLFGFVPEPDNQGTGSIIRLDLDTTKRVFQRLGQCQTCGWTTNRRNMLDRTNTTGYQNLCCHCAYRTPNSPLTAAADIVQAINHLELFSQMLDVPDVFMGVPGGLPEKELPALLYTSLTILTQYADGLRTRLLEVYETYKRKKTQSEAPEKQPIDEAPLNVTTGRPAPKSWVN